MLLILKYSLYKTRENGLLEFKVFKRSIHKIKTTEKQISLNKPENRKKFQQKKETPFRKHILHFLKYMVVQQFSGCRGNAVFFFSCMSSFSVLVALLLLF